MILFGKGRGLPNKKIISRILLQFRPTKLMNVLFSKYNGAKAIILNVFTTLRKNNQFPKAKKHYQSNFFPGRLSNDTILKSQNHQTEKLCKFVQQILQRDSPN